MDKVRIGVVGVGGMGQGHCAYMHELDVAELTAVCDTAPDAAQMVGEKFKVPYFTTAADLMDSGLVDAVLIATPHYDHPPIAIDAFKRGLHVLSEKPIAASVKEASRMIRAADRSGDHETRGRSQATRGHRGARDPRCGSVGYSDRSERSRP